jgi:hypothetical protein
VLVIEKKGEAVQQFRFQIQLQGEIVHYHGLFLEEKGKTIITSFTLES